MKTIKLWDLPTRLFHWLLTAAIIGLFVTGIEGGGLIEWHGKLGILVVGLLVFRVVWGFVGSTYARFGQFLPSPASVLAYLKGSWHGLGHNPVGALSVYVLLSLTAFQAISGLFATDEIAFTGPLYQRIDSDFAVTLTGYHSQVAYVLLALVGLHVAAMIFYAVVKKEGLLIPMITGRKRVAEGESYRGGGIAAFGVALAIAALAVYAASGVWQPKPEPIPASESAPTFDF